LYSLGPNAIQVLNSSLNQTEKLNVKNSILRKFKVTQLKKMRMSEFKRQTKIKIK